MTAGTRPWTAGDVIVYQDVWKGHVYSASPMTVVADDCDLLVAHIPPGAQGWGPAGHRRSRPQADILRNLAAERVSYEQWTWHTNHRLMLFREGDWHCVSLFWRVPELEFAGWYVDLLSPVQRTSIGVASMDRILDIVIAPDLSWRWKDRDSFEAAAAQGIFTSEDAQHIEAEAAKCVRAIESQLPPYSEPWPEWRPDPRRAMPRLPRGWDVPPGSRESRAWVV